MDDGYITFEVEPMTKEEFDKIMPNFPHRYNQDLDNYWDMLN